MLRYLKPAFTLFALLNSGLSSTASSQTSLQTSNLLPDLLNQNFITSNSSIFDYQPITPQAIDLRFLKSIMNCKLKNSEKLKTMLAKNILIIIKTHPILEEYINLALQQSPNLRLYIFSKEELKKHTDYIAYVSPLVESIIISAEDITNNNLQNILRHELRHQAMRVVQRNLNGKQMRSSDCYFPKTKKEKKKIANMLKKGDARVKNLKQELLHELQGTLSREKKEELNRLRQLCINDFLKFYQSNELYTVTKVFLKKFIVNYGKEIKPGSTINLNVNLDILHGPTYITSVTPVDENEVELEVRHQDPLFAIANIIPDQITYVKEHDSSFKYFYERDAYMNGAIPQELIQHFYPEWFQYTNNLIYQAQFTPICTVLDGQLMQRTEPYTSCLDIYKNEILISFTNPFAFDKKYIKKIDDVTNLFIQQQDYDSLKIVLHGLVNHNHFAKEANLMLARANYMQKDYETAVKHYEIAKKQNTVLTEQDKELYKYALYDNSLFKKKNAPLETSTKSVKPKPI